MKKLQLFVLSMAVGSFAFAQRATIQSNVKNQAIPYVKPYAGNEKTHNLVRPNNTRVNAPVHQKAISEVVIGQTTYDLQSNAASQNRLFRHSDGTMSAVWTYSSSGDLPSPDRGTGYAYFDGSNWSTPPTARIEPQRNGWPSISATTSGKEVIVSHNNTAANLYVTTRATKGTGAWSHSSINGPTANGNLWPRMVVGGSNGQTVHVISVTTPTANNGVVHQGLDGALTYSRSTDGGVTWDINQVVLPQINASAGFFGFSGDQYSIDAKGNTVAFVFGGFEESVVLMKSTDNGSNWTMTVVYGHPMGLSWNPSNSISDADGDGTADTLNVCDGTPTVLIDNNGIAHVAFGVMRILKDDPAANGVSFFPATSGIAYWNETMIDSTTNDPLCPHIIIDVEDRDGSGVYLDDFNNIDQIARYYISLTSQPSMGIDANGTLYMAYSALMEGTNNGNGQYYRNIHIIKSSDNGANWSNPLNVTDDDFSEGVFPSIAKNVGTEVHLIYQRDSEPGLAVRGDQDPFGPNEIVYARIPVGDIPSTPNGINVPYCGDDVVIGSVKNINSAQNSLNIYPNPTNGFLNISYISKANGNVNVRLVNLNGQEVMNHNFDKSNGEFFNTINMNNFAKGIYMLQVTTPENTITEKVVSY
jgi:hypothetical protein